MTRPGRPALFCTDGFDECHGHRVTALAPGVSNVTLNADAVVDQDSLDAIELAYFSADAWPDRSVNFMGAALRAPNLRWLHTFSAGVDDPVFRTLAERGVTVTTSSGAAAGPIARSVLMYLLALSRDLPRLLRAQASHDWSPQSFDDLDGRTIGVVGMGPIGREVIRMSAAIGMRPIGMRRVVDGDEPCPTWPLARLPDLAAAVDVLVVALPLTDDTRGIVSADVIGRMQPGAVFVNVGRGELVDEDALAAALRGRRLGGAGLDVFRTEPLPADSPLWDAPNVIVTPHSSGSAKDAEAGSVEIFFANLVAFLAEEPMVNVADLTRSVS
ncbi:MAG: D-2-hydroxyacid dehydrogenase [Acidimicrobiia bacterium]|nr:D-2-hydroxyacid dehydrogenase [Acidimicrobiia bacterium]